jgi:hypothetical protein
MSGSILVSTINGKAETLLAGFGRLLGAAIGQSRVCKLLSLRRLNTLLYKPCVPPSEAQFNCSVSAMPQDYFGKFPVQVGQGTADTRLLRWVQI